MLGDGVNLIARIEEIAQPNTVLLSGRAYAAIQNINSVEARDLGLFQF